MTYYGKRSYRNNRRYNRKARKLSNKYIYLNRSAKSQATQIASLRNKVSRVYNACRPEIKVKYNNATSFTFDSQTLLNTYTSWLPEMPILGSGDDEKYGSKINMVKYENGFWLGVGSAKVALYDDFRDSHLKASEFINFIDYNKHLMNIKGGSKMNDYNLIIITSVQPLHELYKNMSDEPKKQWIRRINNIELNDYNIVEDIDIDAI